MARFRFRISPMNNWNWLNDSSAPLPPELMALRTSPRGLEIIAAEKLRRSQAFHTLFPSTGTRKRDLYPKHCEFFAAGATKKERLFMAANRIGKTVAGAYETTAHLTGLYPPWWIGRRFSAPLDAWACGTNAQTTRGVIQELLLKPGCMIPAECVVSTQSARGLADAVDTIWVRHVSGGVSKLGLKTYEQGRKSFEGAAKHLVWCDEEPPQDCYTEMLYRTATTQGITIITFTPLQGRTEVVTSFLEPLSEESSRSRYVVQAGWKDVPHLDEDEKRMLIANTPPYQIRARTEGEPALGAGAVYPFDEMSIACQPFPIPEFWPRGYGVDVGWERTAVVFGAQDPASDVIYIYDEYYESKGPENAPNNHAHAIRQRGSWMMGAIDPASAYQQLQAFKEIGLNLIPADNDVERGIMAMFEAFSTGRFRVFRNCENWFKEFRQYHRDSKGTGKIVKTNDHLMDASRYLKIMAQQVMRTRPRAPQERGWAEKREGWISR